MTTTKFTDAASARRPSRTAAGISPMGAQRSWPSGLTLLAVASFLAAPSIGAQVPATTTAALQQIFASRQFASERFGPARWIEGGAAYTTLDRSAAIPGGFDIVRAGGRLASRN